MKLTRYEQETIVNFNAEEAIHSFNKGKETILDWNNTEGTVTLSEGNILRVEYTPIIMTKGGGFSFD